MAPGRPPLRPGADRRARLARDHGGFAGHRRAHVAVESACVICKVQGSSRTAAPDVNQATEKPAKPKRAFERVSDAILQDIREEKLRPGDKLPSERALADAFAVNRHAVREALRTLEMSGVLRFAKGASGGAFIRENSADGVGQSIRNMIILGRMPLVDLMVVRVNLLVQAAELAATRATEEDFAALDANIEELRLALVDEVPVETIGPVVGFNRVLGTASHNLVLAMLIDSVADIVTDILKVYKLPTEMELVAPRREIVAALRAGDAARACDLLRTHYEATTSYVLARVGNWHNEGG